MRIDKFILAFVVVIPLILLAAREIAMVYGSGFAIRLSKALRIPIIIMVALFLVVIVFGINEILR